MTAANRSSFLRALLHPRPDASSGAPVIAEVKLRDGDGGDLTGGRDVESIVAGYVAGGARCLSVVTGRWFGGDRELLRRVAACGAGLPILRKDFVTSRAALAETAALGAAAVLLTTRLTRAGDGPGSLLRLVEAALDLGLTPFVEIDDGAQLDALPEGLPGVIAINNSDILDRERSGEGAGRALRLFHRVAALRPAAIVAASAISDVEQARSLVARGFDGLLIGTALMRDPGLLARITKDHRARTPSAAACDWGTTTC